MCVLLPTGRLQPAWVQSSGYFSAALPLIVWRCGDQSRLMERVLECWTGQEEVQDDPPTLGTVGRTATDGGSWQLRPERVDGVRAGGVVVFGDV